MINIIQKKSKDETFPSVCTTSAFKKAVLQKIEKAGLSYAHLVRELLRIWIEENTTEKGGDK